ncbi:hypothetical protein J4225_01900 [Candidatus Pacearchaeota archaeon]|nr:hypothetical protein [Candidatus Pacearchaeota archaeon]
MNSGTATFSSDIEKQLDLMKSLNLSQFIEAYKDKKGHKVGLIHSSADGRFLLRHILKDVDTVKDKLSDLVADFSLESLNNGHNEANYMLAFIERFKQSQDPAYQMIKKRITATSQAYFERIQVSEDTIIAFLAIYLKPNEQG